MALKYTENSVVWYYSYIFLLYNSSKCVPISAECLLQSLCPSTYFSTCTHEKTLASSTYLRDTWYWEVVKKSIEPFHYLIVIWKIWQALRMKPGCLSARISRRHKHSYHPTRKRKKLLLFYTTMRRVFFILIHCFNKWRNLSFLFICFTGIVSIFSIPAKHQNLEGCVRRDKYLQ